MAEESTCPVCRHTAYVSSHEKSHNVQLYMHKKCGPLYIKRQEALMFLQSDAERAKVQPERLQRLLKERELNGDPRPLLVFGQEFPDEFDDAVPIRVSDLLRTWPDTFPERIERSFVCLVRSSDRNLLVGRPVTLDSNDADEHIVFALDRTEVEFFLAAYEEYGWVSKTKQSEWSQEVSITPGGWRKFDELVRRAPSKQNPAFAAMWFGGKAHRNEMDRLWLEFINPAIEAAGYKAKRADTDEHNEPIMDKVVEYIRQAPFVVAELSDRNNGVYYEAGLAKGHGIEVVYCCRARRKPHFDVTAINLVKWKDEKDLRNRLENRIVGTVGQGPHDLRGVE